MSGTARATSVARLAITVEQIEEWRLVPRETVGLEFKEAKKQYDTEKLFAYCVAMGNEGGGYLVLGMTDKPPRKVVGTAAFNSPGGISHKILEHLKFRVDVEEFNHPDGRLVVFIIPSSPKGAPFHFEGKYLMRSDDSIVPMTPEQMRAILIEKEVDWLEEPCAGPMVPGHVSELLDTESFFQLQGLQYPRGAFHHVLER
jgi:ATP-dependent DNA helicase RecG